MKLTDIVQNRPVMKMHGIGNDFLVFNDWNEQLTSEQAKVLAHRNLGVGADGIVTIVKPTLEGAQYQMKFFNPDGTVAQMCGNGIRALGKYLADTEDASGTIRVETGAGLLEPEILSNSDTVANVRVNMGKPVFYDPKLVNANTTSKGEVYLISYDRRVTFVSMGNPHAVINTPHPLHALNQVGAKIESDTRHFPEKTNVEFYDKGDEENALNMFVYERGAGRTLACGTGACATAVAAILDNVVDPSKPVLVHLEGGNLSIEWKNRESPIYMTGEAANVYELDPRDLDKYILQSI